MRRLLPLLLLPCLCQFAYAEEPLTEEAPATAPAAATAPTVAVSSVPERHSRLSWEEHFEQANVAHDGHLTLDEAKSSYRTIARHFHDIDVDGKGYVTQNDVRAWHAFQKAGRAHVQAPEDPLRPRNAFQQQVFQQQRPLNTSADQTVMLPAATPRTPVAVPEAATALAKE